MIEISQWKVDILRINQAHVIKNKSSTCYKEINQAHVITCLHFLSALPCLFQLVKHQPQRQKAHYIISQLHLDQESE